jgi:hypothetical protein
MSCPPAARTVRIGGEDYKISISVQWANEMKGSILVEACADGPSCWRLERMEESIEIPRSSNEE